MCIENGPAEIREIRSGVLSEFSVPYEKDIEIREYEKKPELTRDEKISMSKRFTFALNSFADTKVLVVGCGALGNEVCKNLMFSGFSDITVVDLDYIEKHNLPRACMFRPEDVGGSKSLTMARRMAEVSPFSIHTTGIHGDITRLGAGFIEQFDLVMSPVDCWSVRQYVSKFCHMFDIPHITCATGVLGTDSMLATTVTAEPKGCDVCYECMNPGNLKAEEKKLSCVDYKPETQPQVMPFSSVSAGTAVQIAINCLLGRFHENEKDASGRPKGWTYMTREPGLTPDLDGTSVALSWSQRWNCSCHDFLRQDNLGTIEVRRSEGVEGLWAAVPEGFRGSNPFSIDIRSSGLYYMAFPYHDDDSDTAPAMENLMVYDPDDHEAEDLAFSRLPPDHIYSIYYDEFDGDTNAVISHRALIRIKLV